MGSVSPVKDDKDKFNTYCLQQWAAYVEKSGTLSFKEYLKRNKKLLEKTYDRSKD
jgi:AAA+ superfamily predicted ATPase